MYVALSRFPSKTIAQAKGELYQAVLKIVAELDDFNEHCQISIRIDLVNQPDELHKHGKLK